MEPARFPKKSETEKWRIQKFSRDENLSSPIWVLKSQNQWAFGEHEFDLKNNKSNLASMEML